MQKKKSARMGFLLSLLFLVYFIAAAKPVPREIILTPVWINSFETEDPVIINNKTAGTTAEKKLIPFNQGYNFGYIDESGHFAINRIKSSEIELSEKTWIEYPAQPENIEIKNIEGETIINIENTRGYPILLDDRIFIFGSEQNSLTEIDKNGNKMWTYEFGSILTDIDAAAGLVVAVSIDGVLEILNSKGERIYFFQPGGSRLEVIYGVAISRDGSHIGIISGYDPQRFLLLEKYGTQDGEYRVIFHEFLDKGYRRPVHVLFIDGDSKVVYEREKGINCYNIKSRKSSYIPLDGELTAIDKSGENGLLFLITRKLYQPMQKELIGIKLPKDRSINMQSQDAVFLKAPFKSESVFLARSQTAKNSMLIIGGGASLISFDLEER